MPFWLLSLGGKLLGVFGAVRKGVGAAAGWATENSSHVLIVAGCLAFAALGIHDWRGRSELHKRDAQLARWPVIFAQEHQAFQTEQDSVNTLLAAIRVQNAAVQRMGEEGQRKQLAAASALSAAQARSAHGEVSALAIDRERSERPSQAGCKSGAAVMAARSDL